MSHIKKEEVTIESEGGESLSLFLNSTECSQSIFDYSGVWGMFTNKQNCKSVYTLALLAKKQVRF